MIQAAIFRAIEESLESPKSSLRSSFEFCLFRIQIDGTLDEICRMNFPSRLRESTVLRCCIFDYLAVTLQSNFIHFLRVQHFSNKTQVTKKLTTDEKNMEVNRLLGWAVSKLKHHYERKYHAKKYSKIKKICRNNFGCRCSRGNCEISGKYENFSARSNCRRNLYGSLLRLVNSDSQ